MKSIKRTTKIAGLLYLGLIVFGICAEVIRQKLIVWDNAAETAQNIMDNEWLYRLSFTSDLLMITCFLLLPIALYRLLKSVNKTHAKLMVIFVLVSVPIMFVNMIFHYSALILTSGTDYLKVFETDQLNAFIMLFLEIYTTGVYIATIFHGLWLFPLGFLVYKSGYFPKILGIFLMVACFGFLVDSLQHFLLPDYEWIIYPGAIFEILGEFGFCLWLLFKGAKIPEIESSK